MNRKQAASLLPVCQLTFHPHVRSTSSALSFFSVALSLSPHADSDVWAAASQEEIKKREGNRMFSPMESLYFDL